MSKQRVPVYVITLGGDVLVEADVIDHNSENHIILDPKTGKRREDWERELTDYDWDDLVEKFNWGVLPASS